MRLEVRIKKIIGIIETLAVAVMMVELLKMAGMGWSDGDSRSGV